MTSHTRRAEPTGWAIFAATVLFLAGIFNVICGLTVPLHNQVLTVSASGGLILWDLTSRGWTMLIIGAIMIATGFGLFGARAWARWVAIGFAVLNGVAWMGLINVYPFWWLAIIALDVLVIYNLSARWAPETH